ncbi:MAG: transferase hexapeptide repeat containing protein [Rhodocyclales bacterium]|nr:transferase hexapeptide repeat containing protein [Rhodocyclales bacterium]
MAFLTRVQLEQMGFGRLGENVLISDAARFYNIDHIEIGNHVRIDDFCILSAGSGGIRIGNYVHVACFCSLIGKELINIRDFANLSSRVAIYASSDDFSGASLTNPMVPEHYRHVQHEAVDIGRHAIIGAGSVILPGIVVGEGAAAGALTLIKNNLDPFAMYVGVPARKIGERKRDLLELEKQLKS